MSKFILKMFDLLIPPQKMVLMSTPSDGVKVIASNDEFRRAL